MNNFNFRPQPQFQNPKTAFNPYQFAQIAPSITDNMLQQLVEQAKTLGIPQEQIDNGIKYISSLKQQ